MTHSLKPKALATAVFSVLLTAMTTLAVVSCSTSKPTARDSSAANKAARVVAALHNPQSRYVVVVSHRGDWRNYPENSLPAIESVIRMGVDMMELDLKMTRDSVLVLCHDGTLDRTTTGSGPVSKYTYAELQQFDLKRGHGIAIPGLKIPTLRQALQVCKDRITVNVDQGYDYYDQVLAITEELGMTDQVLIKNGQPLDKVQQKMSRHAHKMMYMPVVSVAGGSDMTTFNSYLTAPQRCPLPLNCALTRSTTTSRTLPGECWMPDPRYG